MSETVSILIGTFGDLEAWRPLAYQAADSASALTQTVAPHQVIWRHANTLQEARNGAASEATGDWLVFLDADDQLDCRYVEKMLEGAGDLRQPATLYVQPDGSRPDKPSLLPSYGSLANGNWIIIGAGIRRGLFEKVGGFGDEALYEDWALWWRCWLAGADIGTAPEAVYQVNLRSGSRNDESREQQVYWYHKIHRELSRHRRAA